VLNNKITVLYFFDCSPCTCGHQRNAQYITENNLKLILDFVVVKWIGLFIAVYSYYKF